MPIRTPFSQADNTYAKDFRTGESLKYFPRKEYEEYVHVWNWNVGFSCEMYKFVTKYTSSILGLSISMLQC